MLRNKDVHVGFVLDSGDWEGETLLLFRDPLCVVSRVPVKFVNADLNLPLFADEKLPVFRPD